MDDISLSAMKSARWEALGASCLSSHLLPPRITSHGPVTWCLIPRVHSCSCVSACTAQRCRYSQFGWLFRLCKKLGPYENDWLLTELLEVLLWLKSLIWEFDQIVGEKFKRALVTGCSDYSFYQSYSTDGRKNTKTGCL